MVSLVGRRSCNPGLGAISCVLEPCLGCYINYTTAESRLYELGPGHGMPNETRRRGKEVRTFSKNVISKAAN